MDLSSQETLQQLLKRLVDADLSIETREGAADRIRERYPVETCLDEYARIACHGLIEDMTVSFILRILYVCVRKWPDRPDAKMALARVLRDGSRSQDLRTQAFMHLLLADIDAAEAAARSHMPEMLTLVSAERRYPTIRRVDDPEDAPYEEAMLKLLFH
ncbi:MAG TPA: hypothetical protein VL283_02810 [Candidatus Baltobacteraceae bacterium]|nr:hypothetical protein [Candidatus Baltobacteraceae bacterium]